MRTHRSVLPVPLAGSQWGVPSTGSPPSQLAAPLWTGDENCHATELGRLFVRRMLASRGVMGEGEGAPEEAGLALAVATAAATARARTGT